jgi:hypothetical protein
MTIKKLWTAYKGYVEASTNLEKSNGFKDISYWRHKLFKNSILYSLPVSFLASVPAIVIAVKEGSVFKVAFDVVTVMLLAYFGLSKRINDDYKKILVWHWFMFLQS